MRVMMAGGVLSFVMLLVLACAARGTVFVWGSRGRGWYTAALLLDRCTHSTASRNIVIGVSWDSLRWETGVHVWGRWREGCEALIEDSKG